MSTELTITILFSDIKERCKKLAVYEGRDRHTGSGDSSYERIIITEQDEPLIDEFLSISLANARAALEDMISQFSDNSTTVGSTSVVNGEQWTIRPDKRYDTKNFGKLEKHLHEALASSVMAGWLTYVGEDQRAAFYKSLYDNELLIISANLHTKAAPKRPQP